MTATLLRFRPRPLASPLSGVSDAAWTHLVRALEVQPPRAVSKSGGYGSYDLRPRRLVELGRAINLRSARSDVCVVCRRKRDEHIDDAYCNGKFPVGAECPRFRGRQVYACDLLPPLTEKRLLTDPLRQLAILRQSLVAYHEQLSKNEIVRPEGVTVAGALAILHVGGHGALKSWPKLFPETRALYDAARGAF